MRIGYACYNYAIADKTIKTFRLSSYTAERFDETVRNNLEYLKLILEFNQAHGIGFFRISSEIIPFASHSVCKVNWQQIYKEELSRIGGMIQSSRMRISMHPDQFVLINSPRREVVAAGIRDLQWHARFMDLLGLDHTAKIQIHVGGVYGHRVDAIRRFISNYVKLPLEIRDRLAIENDDKCFPLSDCMRIHEAVGVPVIFDNFHHESLHQGETMFEAALQARSTWDPGKDGAPMMDYSSQQPGAAKGRHADSIDGRHFKDFLSKIRNMELDLMLEIKDKERSALIARAMMEREFANLG